MLEIEEHIPKENWYVGLLWKEGYWFFQTIRKQGLTFFRPHIFNSAAVIAVNATSGWEAPADALGRFYLEPQEEETVYQIYYGLSPSQTRSYLQYTQREDRLSLIAVRGVPGNIGFYDGETTPYADPAPLTEMWTVNDIYPYINVENHGITGKSVRAYASFYITPYTYRVVKDRNKIMEMLKGNRPATIRTMGDGYRPIQAPAWLREDYEDWMVQPEALQEVK